MGHSAHGACLFGTILGARSRMVDMEVRAFDTTQEHAAAAMRSPRVSPRPGALPPYAACAVERLFEASRRPIAVVVAPAGFGKSALLRAFATMCESAVHLDLAGSEPTFRGAIRDLCEALRGVAPGARLSFASAYARAAERGDRAAALAVWLARYLKGRDVTIVVDSIDRLGDDARLFSEFAEVLARRGAFGPRLVVAARDTADLPVPRWLAADLIAMPVGEGDLRWTVSDARAAAGLPLHPLLEGQSSLGKLIVDWDGAGYRYEEGLRSRAEQTLRTDLGSHQCVAERTVNALEAVGRIREALDIARNAELRDHV